MDAWDLGGQQEKLAVTSFEGMGSSQQDIKQLKTVFKLTLDREMVTKWQLKTWRSNQIVAVAHQF